MIASKIADCFRKTGNGQADRDRVAQMIHEFLRSHLAGENGKAGEADEGFDEFRDVPDSVEALVVRH